MRGQKGGVKPSRKEKEAGGEMKLGWGGQLTTGKKGAPGSQATGKPSRSRPGSKRARQHGAGGCPVKPQKACRKGRDDRLSQQGEGRKLTSYFSDGCRSSQEIREEKCKLCENGSQWSALGEDVQGRRAEEKGGCMDLSRGDGEHTAKNPQSLQKSLRVRLGP